MGNPVSGRQAGQELAETEGTCSLGGDDVSHRS